MLLLVIDCFLFDLRTAHRQLLAGRLSGRTKWTLRLFAPLLLASAWSQVLVVLSGRLWSTCGLLLLGLRLSLVLVRSLALLAAVLRVEEVAHLLVGHAADVDRQELRVLEVVRDGREDALQLAHKLLLIRLVLEAAEAELVEVLELPVGVDDLHGGQEVSVASGRRLLGRLMVLSWGALLRARLRVQMLLLLLLWLLLLESTIRRRISLLLGPHKVAQVRPLLLLRLLLLQGLPI